MAPPNDRIQKIRLNLYIELMTKLAASQVSAVSIPLPSQVYEEKVRAYVRGEGTSHWAMFRDVKLKPRCAPRIRHWRQQID